MLVLVVLFFVVRILPFFPIPFIILALLSPSLPVVTQIRGHIAGPPPPSPLRYVPSFLSREEFIVFFPLLLLLFLLLSLFLSVVGVGVAAGFCIEVCVGVDVGVVLMVDVVAVLVFTHGTSETSSDDIAAPPRYTHPFIS